MLLQQHITRERLNNEVEYEGLVSEGVGQCMPFGHDWSPNSTQNTDGRSDNVRVYYINLDSSLERRSVMEKELQKSSLVAKRFSAVVPEQVASSKLLAKYVTNQGICDNLQKWPTEQNTTVACYISHMEALKQAQRELDKDQVVLIMEDDVSIPINFKSLVKHTMALAPSDWALLKLSHWGFVRPADIVAEHKSGHNETISFYQLRPPFREILEVPAPSGSPSLQTKRMYYAGTGGYLVKVSSIPKVLDHLQRQPIDNIDGMMLSSGELLSYQVRPQIVCLSSLSRHSDIVGHKPPASYLVPHRISMPL